MPVIDRIKISQEINFNGMPTWIGIEAALLPGEDEKEGLRQIQKVITEYQDEEQKAYTQSGWGRSASKADNKTDAIGSMVNSINSCTELNVLETYKLMAKSNLELQDAYEKKLKELQ